MQKMTCNICGWVYDPAVGDPANNVKPGTPFDQLPADFICSECGAGKDNFSPA